MPLEDILVALRAVDEGAIDREDLTRLLAILDTWDRGGLKPSCGELLSKQFRVDPAKIRRWEREITGQARRRIGRYHLKRKVGQGGMGLVFEAIDPNLGRTVALKLLAGDRLESPTSVQRFLREAKSAGSFNHPNIVHAYDAGIDGDLPFLVMEFVDGENLYQVLKRRGSIEVEEGLDWLLQGAHALAVLERQRWVHGDVKPSNFILTREGVVKLADLGLCGPPGKPRKGSSPHGTPPYIAPEVLAGDFIDHRADLYSLGATWYHLFAGRPHRLARSIEQLRDLAGEPIDPIGEIRPDLPEKLRTILHRLLSARPKDRFPGGAALLAALEPLVPEPTVELDTMEVEQIAAATEVATRPRRGMWITLVLAVVAVGIAIGIVAGPGLGGGRNEEGPGSRGEGGGEVVEPDRGSGRAEWEAVQERLGVDYPGLLAWLAAEGSVHREAEVWRAELLAELAEIAEPVWSELSSEAEVLSAAGRFHAALSALDRMPAHLRAGPYEVAWDAAVEGARRDRQARLARLLLRFENAAEPLEGWHAWRALDAESPEDRRWYRGRIEEELGGLPFLAAIDAAVAEAHRLAGARPAEVRAQLRAGEIPTPRIVPGPRLPDELALAWLAARPEIGGSAEPLLDRLHRTGYLATMPPDLLARLLAMSGEVADAEAEVVAARLAREASRACRAFDRTAAEDRLALLAVPRLEDTVAAREVRLGVERVRRELARGAFLRSPAFVAEVRGAWGETPTFRWVGEETRLFEEWRADRDRWSAEEGGLRTRGRGPWQGLELAIPFEPSFALTLEVEVPDDRWALAIGRGGAAVGVSGVGGGGNCRATGGSRETVAELIGQGRGAPWILPVDHEFPRRLRVTVSYEKGAWRLGDDAAILFPTTEDPPPAWIWCALPPGCSLRAIEITGNPVPEWLDARAALARP